MYRRCKDRSVEEMRAEEKRGENREKREIAGRMVGDGACAPPPSPVVAETREASILSHDEEENVTSFL